MNLSNKECKLFLLDYNVLMDVMKEEGVKPDLIICDPPYDISSSNSEKFEVISSNSGGGRYIKMNIVKLMLTYKMIIYYHLMI